MTEDYQDPERVDLYGLIFRATNEQESRIWLRLIGTPEYRHFAKLAALVEHCRLQFDDMAEDLVSRMVDARIAVTHAAAGILEAEGLLSHGLDESQNRDSPLALHRHDLQHTASCRPQTRD